MGRTACPWCHTMVEKPCSTAVEGKMCPEPYTLTDEQAARVDEIVKQRRPLREDPLPIDDFGA